MKRLYGFLVAKPLVGISLFVLALHLALMWSMWTHAMVELSPLRLSESDDTLFGLVVVVGTGTIVPIQLACQTVRDVYREWTYEERVVTCSLHRLEPKKCTASKDLSFHGIPIYNPCRRRLYGDYHWMWQ